MTQQRRPPKGGHSNNAQTFFLRSEFSTTKFHQHFLPLPLPRAIFLPLRYIHKGVSLMLVFGYLERRTFKLENQKQCKRRCYGCGISIPWVCFGAFCPCTLLRAIYTQRGCLFARLFSMVSYATNSERVKVQIPTFFVCGCRITD